MPALTFEIRHGADGHGLAGQPRPTHRQADRMGRRASARRTRWRSRRWSGLSIAQPGSFQERAP